ncbi:hypothetical protein Tco_0328212 [Tanacetum coccineum]
MAPESSKGVVLPKFDMHIHTSILSAKELKEAVTKYCIPVDLHPHLPPSKLTMNKLLPNDQTFRGARFSCKQGNWFSFENKIGRRAKKCFEEVTFSLKKKFFMIDRRAIPDTMPWRHIGTDLRDDFPKNYNEGDAEHSDEKGNQYDRVLLSVDVYICVLSYLFFSFFVMLTMDAFLKLPVWNGIVISKGDPILDSQRPPLRITPPLEAGKLISEKSPAQRNLENPNSKIAAAREKKEHQNLVKAQAKRARERGLVAPRKKKVCRNQEPIGSRSEGVIPATPLYHVAQKLDATTTAIPKDTTGNAATKAQGVNVEREIMDLSGNTHVPTPLVIVTQPSVHTEHDDARYNVVFFDAHSFHSTHHEDTDEDVVDHWFMPDWGLYDDLRICTFKECKELVSYLATPTEKEFLGGLSNVEVVRHSYQSLGQCVLSQDRLRSDLQREMQANDGLSKKFVLLDSAHSSCSDREKKLLDWLKDIEKERDDWRQIASKQPMLHHRLVRRFESGKNQEEIVAMLSKTSNLDIKDGLMEVSPDVPPPAANDRTGPSTETVTNDVTLYE